MDLIFNTDDKKATIKFDKATIKLDSNMYECSSVRN